MAVIFHNWIDRGSQNRPPSRRQAVSLLEAVISSFILMSAFLVLFALMDSAFGFMERSTAQQLAATVAERQLQGMRIWSETPNGGQYNFQNPGLVAIYDGATTVPPDFSDFSIATKVTTVGLYSGCTGLELSVNSAPYFSPPFVVPRYLDGCAAKVQITVRWSGGQKRTSLVSLLSAPSLSPATVNPMDSVPPVPASLAEDAGINFYANATDSTGQVIKGLTFSWYIVPISGTGTLTQARDGSVANLTNRLYGPPFVAPDFFGTPCYSGGQCYVQAAATYHGQNLTVAGPPVNLAP